MSAPARKRNGFFTRLLIDGRPTCIDCLEPYQLRSPKSRDIRCSDCATSRYWKMVGYQNAACRLVHAAMRRGDIPAPASLACVDCGAQARDYDHRDYTQPLKVDPVCRSCNVMRGFADVWPDGFDPRPRMLAERPQTVEA